MRSGEFNPWQLGQIQLSFSREELSDLTKLSAFLPYLAERV